MKSFLQYITETWSITPVDLNSFHPDYVDVDGEPSEIYHIYKNPNGIHTHIDTSPSPDLRSVLPADLRGPDKKISIVDWKYYGPRDSTKSSGHELINTVLDHIHDHIIRHRPDAIVYGTIDPVRHGIYQRAARLAGIRAINWHESEMVKRGGHVHYA